MVEVEENKIHGGAIRPAPLGGKDDDDPCTNNGRRAKLKIEHGEPEELHVEGASTSIHMQAVDKTPSKESAPGAFLRDLPTGSAVDVASVVIQDSNYQRCTYAQRLRNCRQRNLRLGRRGAF